MFLFSFGLLEFEFSLFLGLSLLFGKGLSFQFVLFLLEFQCLL